jgi:hypothetical protein
MKTVVLRKHWLARRGVYASSIGLPEHVAMSYAKGQPFEVSQLASGQIVLTPVRQPPAAA